jgi:hypothetical protein
MSMTVTVDGTASKISNGINLRVLVLTNVAATQDGAAVHTNINEHQSITPTEIGSRIYGAALNTSASGFAVNGITTAIDNIVDSTNSGRYATCKSSADTTALTVETIGYSNARNTGGISLFEVKNDGVNSIFEDSSGPAVATVTNNSVVTSAAFTPPPGAWLVALSSGMYGSPPSISDTMGLSWTTKSSLQTGSGGQAVIMIARVPNISSGSVSLGKFGLTGSGSEEDSGSGSIDMGKMGLSASGTETDAANGSVNLPKMNLSGAGNQRNPAIGSIDMGKFGLSAAGTVMELGSGSVSLGKMGFSGSGSESDSGFGLVTLPKMKLGGAGQEFDVAAGTISIHKLGLSGAGDEFDVGGGVVAVGKLGLSGTGNLGIAGSGAADLGKLGLSGTGTEIGEVSGSGSVKMHKPRLAGAGQEYNFAAGMISMHKMKLAGTGKEGDPASGIIAMHKMKLGGTGVELQLIFGTGSVILKKAKLAGTGAASSVGSAGVILQNSFEGGVDAVDLVGGATGNTGGAASGPMPLIGHTAQQKGYNLNVLNWTPPVPVSNVAIKNLTGPTVSVVVTGGTVTNVVINGSSAGSGPGTYSVPNNQTIKLVYSSKPTWAWTGVNPSFTRLQTAQYANGIDIVKGGITYPSPVSGLNGAPALVVQKWFVPEGSYYTTQSAIPNDLTDLIDNGCKIVLCIKPGSSTAPFQQTAADRQNFAKTVYAFSSYAASKSAPAPIIVMDSEANANGDFDVTGKARANPGQASANAYISWYNYYAPAAENPTAYVSSIPAGSGLDPGIDFATNHSSGGNYQQFYPGDTHVRFVGGDAYGNLYINDDPWYIDQPNGMATVALTDLADNNAVHGPVPFWIFEWGADQQGVSDPVTPEEWQKWSQYLIGVFSTRAKAGKPAGGIIWYSGTNYPEYNLLPGDQPGGIGFSLISGLNNVKSSLQGGSGAYFDNVHRGTGATIQFDNSHPARTPMAARFITDSSGEIAWISWKDSLNGTAEKLYFRIYAYFDALPSATTIIGQFLTDSGAVAASLHLSTAGLIQFNDGVGGTGQIGTAVPIRTGHWWRVEGFVSSGSGSGQLEFKLFNNADSFVPDDIQTSTATFNTGADMASVQFGISSSSVANAAFSLDDLGVSTFGYMGPTILGTDQGTGTVDMGKIGLTGAGISTRVGSGSVNLPKLGLTGSGLEKNIGTGHISLKKPSLWGATLTPVSVCLNGRLVPCSVKARVNGEWVTTVPKVRIAGSWVPIS